MGRTVSRRRIYASLLALGAGILVYRSITLVSLGALYFNELWVSILLITEMLIDFGCLLSSIRWWISNDRAKATIALRLGAAAAILHALRVLIFVLGRVGPWINFDVRPEHRELHHERWTMTGVYFAAIMSILGVIGVIVIWTLIRRARRKHDTVST